jgi:hypothetical protein
MATARSGQWQHGERAGDDCFSGGYKKVWDRDSRVGKGVEWKKMGAIVLLGSWDNIATFGEKMRLD